MTVVRFPGNPRPAVRHREVPVVIVLPVIRIERYAAAPTKRVKRGRRRPKELRG